ncbi:MAG: hypothetical protein ACJ72O_12035 [Marmoricola sp.]
MSWTETHRRWQALQEIEALASAGCEELPWNTEYAEIFGDRDALAATLRYRLKVTRDAQLDTHLPEGVLEEQRVRLVERNAGVVRLLRHHESGAAPTRTPAQGRIPNQRRDAPPVARPVQDTPISA